MCARRYRADRNRCVAGVFGGEDHALGVSGEALDGEFAVNHRNHDHANFGADRSVDDEQVAVVDAGALHRAASGAEEEGRCGAGDQLLVEVEGAFDVVVCGGGEARFHTRG